jgi:CCR4-NOT complex subunit CAF16
MQVLGKSPFHDTQLTVSGDLAYVGGTWVKDVAFAGYAVPLAVSWLVGYVVPLAVN